MVAQKGLLCLHFIFQNFFNSSSFYLHTCQLVNILSTVSKDHTVGGVKTNRYRPASQAHEQVQRWLIKVVWPLWVSGFHSWNEDCNMEITAVVVRERQHPWSSSIVTALRYVHFLGQCWPLPLCSKSSLPVSSHRRHLLSSPPPHSHLWSFTLLVSIVPLSLPHHGYQLKHLPA